MRSTRKSFSKSKPVFGKKTLKECTTSGDVNRVLSQSKPLAGKRTLRRCTKSLSINDVVLIDVDSDDFHDVIVVDMPESLFEKLGKRSTSKVISIDDDDEEGHTDRTLDEDANPTSRDSYPASTSSPVKLSKFKRTYSGMMPRRAQRASKGGGLFCDCLGNLAQPKDFVYLLYSCPHDWLFLQCTVFLSVSI
ncbi:hypothetical protein Droror1_Dr00024493 [Drosera rotundifolia]